MPDANSLLPPTNLDRIGLRNALLESPFHWSMVELTGKRANIVTFFILAPFAAAIR